MKYKKILLKLSGEALLGGKQFGIDNDVLEQYAQDIFSIVKQGIKVGIVIGGGNIFRGLQGANSGMNRSHADYMGMLATVINSMAIQSALEQIKVKSKVMSAFRIDHICELFDYRKAKEYLENNYVVIISAGTGNPYFTTDTAAALRAAEIGAEVLLKGTS
jgi:uridylate kinase